MRFYFERQVGDLGYFGIFAHALSYFMYVASSPALDTNWNNPGQQADPEPVASVAIPVTVRGQY